MGTNLTRNGADSGTNKTRAQFTTKLRWNDANFTWDDDAADQTWDDAAGTPGGTNAGTNKTRNSSPSGTNLTRN